MVKNSTIAGAAVLVGLLALAIQVGFAVLFVFMFIWNMIGALVLIPALSHFLLNDTWSGVKQANAAKTA